MSPGATPICFSRESRYSSSDTFSYGKKSCRPVGAQRSSQSRGQLVSHSSLPSGVSTSTQCVGHSIHSGGWSLVWRVRMARPGASSNQVRSVLIAPQGRMLTVVPVAMVAPSSEMGGWRYRGPGRAPPRPRQARELSTSRTFRLSRRLCEASQVCRWGRPSPEPEVAEREGAERVDQHQGHGPGPLPAADRARRPAHEIDERRRLQRPLDGGAGQDQPAAALAEIAPPTPGHGSLLALARTATVPRPPGAREVCCDETD